jgi:hypothetical protein
MNPECFGIAYFGFILTIKAHYSNKKDSIYALQYYPLTP